MADFLAIQTARLLLLPLTAADAVEFQRLTDDPAIIEAISFLRAPFTIDDARVLIGQNTNGRDLFRGVRRRADNVLVGMVGSHDRGTRTVEIGYWIGTTFHRQGYASEAARGVIGWLRQQNPPPRVVAECRPENRASWRLLEGLGFQPTGAAGARRGRVELELPG